MSLRKSVATDSQKEVTGIRVEISDAPNDDGTIPTFIVSRMGGSNKAYSKAIELATRPYRRQMQLGIMNNDKAEEIFKTVFVTNIIKGWENVLKSDVFADETLEGYCEFTSGNCLALLNQECYADLYARLQTESNTAANFRLESLGEEEKN